MNDKQLEDYITKELTENTLEDILELYDLTPQDVFVLLYKNGLIDDSILEGQVDAYN